MLFKVSIRLSVRPASSTFFSVPQPFLHQGHLCNVPFSWKRQIFYLSMKIIFWKRMRKWKRILVFNVCSQDFRHLFYPSMKNSMKVVKGPPKHDPISSLRWICQIGLKWLHPRDETPPQNLREDIGTSLHNLRHVHIHTLNLNLFEAWIFKFQDHGFSMQHYYIPFSSTAKHL